MPRLRKPVGAIVQWGDDGQRFVKVAQPDDWQHYTSGGKHDKANKAFGDFPMSDDLEKAETVFELTPLCMEFRKRISGNKGCKP